VVTARDEAVQAVARVLAMLEPGEDWPTNAALGGNATGTRDDEFRDGCIEQAEAAVAVVWPLALAAAAEAVGAEAARLDALTITHQDRTAITVLQIKRGQAIADALVIRDMTQGGVMGTSSAESRLAAAVVPEEDLLAFARDIVALYFAPTPSVEREDIRVAIFRHIGGTT
jgi:hypothetical protein